MIETVACWFLVVSRPLYPPDMFPSSPPPSRVGVVAQHETLDACEEDGAEWVETFSYPDYPASYSCVKGVKTLDSIERFRK